MGEVAVQVNASCRTAQKHERCSSQDKSAGGRSVQVCRGYKCLQESVHLLHRHTGHAQADGTTFGLTSRRSAEGYSPALARALAANPSGFIVGITNYSTTTPLSSVSVDTLLYPYMAGAPACYC